MKAGDLTAALMNAAEPQFAWQPFTFRGVAAFGAASWGRTYTMVLLCGLLVAMLVVWSLTISFVPSVEQAIEQLPSTGGIEQGRLFWPRRQRS